MGCKAGDVVRGRTLAQKSGLDCNKEPFTLDDTIFSFLSSHWRVSIINEAGTCRAGVLRPDDNALRWHWCQGATPREALAGLMRSPEN